MSGLDSPAGGPALGEPPCDLCADGTPASCDSSTIFGCWANLCEPCRLKVGVGTPRRVAR